MNVHAPSTTATAGAAGPAAPQSLGRRFGRTLRRHPGIMRLIVIAALFVLWEIAARYWVDPMFISPPSRVIGSLDAVFNTRGVP